MEIQVYIIYDCAMTSSALMIFFFNLRRKDEGHWSKVHCDGACFLLGQYESVIDISSMAMSPL